MEPGLYTLCVLLHVASAPLLIPALQPRPLTPRLPPPITPPAAAYSVKTVLQSIQSLLADPNVDSPLNTHAAKLWGVNDAAYRALVQSTYNGPKAA